jgi:hypothetical protein
VLLFSPPAPPQDQSTFAFIFTSLEMGLKSTDVAISTSCASAVDDLAGYYFKYLIQVGQRSAAVTSRCVCVARQHRAADPPAGLPVSPK